MIVNTPDGQVNFPDSMSQDEVKGVLQKKYPKPYDDTSAVGLAGDTAYRAANTGTLGALDYGLAGLHAIERGTGYDPNATDLATIHKQNDQWGSAHPYLGFGADLVGYGAGLGKIGLGAKIGARIGEGALARMAGAGIENAGASAISEEANTAGQASVGDLLKHAVISGTVGAATGAIPGQKGKLADAPSPTAALGKDTAAAFTPLETTHYHPGDIANIFDTVKTNMPAKNTASPTLKSKISDISDNISAKLKARQSVTADDLTNFQIDLNKASEGGRDTSIVKAYNDALDQTMANNKPIFSPLGSPAAVAAQSDAARAAALKENVSGDLDNWMASAKKNTEATKEAILQKTNAYPDFYASNNVGDLLKQMSQPMGLAGKIGTKLANPIGDFAVTGLGDYIFGSHDPTTSFLLGLGGAAGGAAVSHGLAQSRANTLTKNLAQARHLNATGQTVPASAFNRGIPVVGPLGDLARQSGVGVGMSNLFNR